MSEVKEVKEKIEETIEEILYEAPLSAGRFCEEFQLRTGWSYWFGETEAITKELRHGIWEVRVDNAEDIVKASEDKCYAVKAEIMWVIDTYNDHFYVLDVDVRDVRELSQKECRDAMKRMHEEEDWWEEEEYEDWEEDEEWEEEVWEEEGI
jgi:hypothetical protein